MNEFNDLDIAELDLDSVDISEDDILDDIELEDFGKVSYEIQEEHIRVDAKAFKTFLKTAKQVTSASGRDVITRSICVVPSEEFVDFYATDFDVYLHYRVPKLNQINNLTDSMVIPIDILEKLTKATPSNIIIYKSEIGEYMLKLITGDIPLEVIDVDTVRFIFDEELVMDTVISAKKLNLVLRDFQPVVTASVSPQERRIFCTKDEAVVTHLWSIISAKDKFSDMDLKVKDIDVLRKLLMDRDEEIEVLNTKEDAKTPYKSFRGYDFEYTFLTSSLLEVSEQLKEHFDEVVSGDGIYVDFNQLYKMVELTAELPYSVGKLELNYTDSALAFTMLTKKPEDPKFYLEGSSEGVINPLKDPLSLQAKLLKSILKPFARQSSIKIILTDLGLGIVSEDYKAVLYSENR